MSRQSKNRRIPSTVVGRESWLRYTAIPLALFLIGCSTKEPLKPPVEIPQAFSRTGESTVPDKWWKSFNDPELNRRIERALDDNLSLAAVWERLQEARALVKRESGDFYPQLEGFADGGYYETNNGEGDAYGIGLAAEYEVDLWGRIRSQVEAEEFRAATAYSDYQTAALSLSAEIGSSYFQLLEALNQRDLLDKQLEVNQQVLRSLEARYGGGLIRSADILRQEQLVENTREQRIIVEAAIAVQENRLAVLEGQAPENGRPVTDKPLPSLPPLPRTGLPSELVERRPDIQAAFNLVRAANKDLAVAMTNRYPRLVLTASIEAAAENPSDLFTTWLRSIAGQLAAPLFTGGRLSAEVERQQAIERRRLMDYGQAVLLAFEEVENALVREQKQTERIDSIQRQTELARSAYNRLQIEYSNGLIEYLDVLTALVEVQRLQRQLLTAQRSRIEFRIALYRALAGGFKTERELIAQQDDPIQSSNQDTWQLTQP